MSWNRFWRRIAFNFRYSKASRYAVLRYAASRYTALRYAASKSADLIDTRFWIGLKKFGETSILGWIITKFFRNFQNTQFFLRSSLSLSNSCSAVSRYTVFPGTKTPCYVRGFLKQTSNWKAKFLLLFLTWPLHQNLFQHIVSAVETMIPFSLPLWHRVENYLKYDTKFNTD